MAGWGEICYTECSEVRTLLRTVYVSCKSRRAGKSAVSQMTRTTNRKTVGRFHSMHFVLDKNSEPSFCKTL